MIPLVTDQGPEAFWESAAKLFTPGGPGRITFDLSDTQILDLVLDPRITKMWGGSKLSVDNALFISATPAGIVGVRRAQRPEGPEPKRTTGGALYFAGFELPEGRHDRGWPGGRRIARRIARQAAAKVGDAIVRAGS